eukprot:scaffold27570_cov34-Tisochrysis_lutea.AAC.5
MVRIALGRGVGVPFTQGITKAHLDLRFGRLNEVEKVAVFSLSRERPRIDSTSAATLLVAVAVSAIKGTEGKLYFKTQRCPQLAEARWGYTPPSECSATTGTGRSMVAIKKLPTTVLQGWEARERSFTSSITKRLIPPTLYNAMSPDVNALECLNRSGVT